MLQPHSNDWYDILARSQASYYYPWKSELSDNHGEDNYLHMLKKELKQSHNVIDIGCGSGELTNTIAEYCNSITGYDRLPRFIRTARSNRKHNADFILFDAKTEDFNTFPTDLHSYDFVISSKGPLHWIGLLPPFLKPGCRMLMLVPYCIPPEWNSALPDEFKITGYSRDYILDKIRSLLAVNGLRMEQKEFYEADELFGSKDELYTFLTWGRFGLETGEDEIRQYAERIFTDFGKNGKVAYTHCRLIWRSVKR